MFFSDAIQAEKDFLQERRDLAVEFIQCLMLIEVLKMLPFHPGHEDLIQHTLDLAFKRFKVRDRYVTFTLDCLRFIGKEKMGETIITSVQN